MCDWLFEKRGTEWILADYWRLRCDVCPCIEDMTGGGTAHLSKVTGRRNYRDTRSCTTPRSKLSDGQREESLEMFSGVTHECGRPTHHLLSKMAERIAQRGTRYLHQAFEGAVHFLDEQNRAGERQRPDNEDRNNSSICWSE